MEYKKFIDIRKMESRMVATKGQGKKRCGRDSER
jgi:hypothetical protein